MVTDAETNIDNGLNLNLNKLTKAMFTLHTLDSFCADTKTYPSTVHTEQQPGVAQVIHTCIKHHADAVGREGSVH